MLDIQIIFLFYYYNILKSQYNIYNKLYWYKKINRKEFEHSEVKKKKQKNNVAHCPVLPRLKK